MDCPSCDFQFENREGILCALPPQRRRAYARFLEEYLIIRKAEGRGSEDAACYLALPFHDLTGRNSEQWSMRGRTYRYFERRVLPQFEGDRALDILDLGAGTGWLSYRLAERKHRPVAVDILTDARDGLGAARHYRAELVQPFPLIAAEFDNLPFADAQFDLAVFNSSLHYSTDYSKTLNEAKRCLKPAGSVIVLDSPIYRLREHGERMREERHRYFEAKYGFRSDSIPSLEFLHDALLRDLTDGSHLRWKVHRPWYGWKWHMRPWKARLANARPPSRFHILVGSWVE
jgi:SAM-dependent methyltransferase